MGVTGDAVATGLVESLARPGGNVTGSSFFVGELSAKRLEFLKEALPHLSRVGVLLNPDSPGNSVTVEMMEQTARSMKLHLQAVEARGPADVEGALSTLVKRQAGALSVYEDALPVEQARKLDVAVNLKTAKALALTIPSLCSSAPTTSFSDRPARHCAGVKAGSGAGTARGRAQAAGGQREVTWRSAEDVLL
jgi:ABC transporter substrate binding protein